MNVLGRVRSALDMWDRLLLSMILVAGAALLVVLLWPAIEEWQNRPRPGAQVCQQCPRKTGDSGDSDAVRTDYLLYLPLKYQDDQKWPLVVFLHGAGERGEDPRRVLRHGLPKLIHLGEQFDFILVSPQCATNEHWEPKSVIELIEHVSGSLSVDRQRVYLTGYSMGGTGTCAVAAYDPDRFAAVAPLCGGGDVAYASRLKDVPIWAFHGAADKTVSLETSQAMVDAVRKCDGHAKLTIYPDLGHDICDVTYKNPAFYEWLLAQRRHEPLKKP